MRQSTLTVIAVLLISYQTFAQTTFLSKDSLNTEWQNFSSQLDSLSKKRQWQAFLQTAENMRSFAKKHYSEQHKNYHLAINHMVKGFYQTNQKNKAEELLSTTIKQIESRVPFDSLHYASHSFTLADLINGFEGIKIFDHIAKKFENSMDSTLLSYRNWSLDQCGVLWWNMNIEAEKSMLYLQKATEGFQKSKDLNGYAHSMQTLGLFYRQRGEYNKGIKTLQKALEIAPDKSPIISTLALIYTDMKLYDKSLMLFEKNVALMAQKDSTSANYGLELDNLGYAYQQAGQYEKALSMTLKALAIIEKARGKKAVLQWSHAAVQHLRLKNTAEALKIAKELEDYLNASPNKRSQFTLFIMDNLAEIYQDVNDAPKAIKYYEMILENSKDIWGKGEEHYVTPVEELILLYNHLGQSDKSLAFARELAQNMNEYALFNFELLPEKYKEEFINKYAGRYLPILLSNLMHYKDKDPLSISLTYDALLAMKGAVLQSTRRLNETFINQQDSSTRNLLVQRQNFKQILAKLYSSRSTQNSNNAKDSLENGLIEVESKILQRLPDFEQSFKNIRYKEVKKWIHKDTVAIEFIHFRYHNTHNWTDSTMYGAIIAHSGQENPTFVPLFEEKSLKSILENTQNPNRLYAIRNQIVANDLKDNNKTVSLPNAQVLYNLIWKPLENHVQDAHVVYYAPSGLLNQVALTALALNDSTRLSDKYVLNTLSSTRELAFELAEQKSTEAIKTKPNILVYGGINYDADSLSLKQAVFSKNRGELDTDDLLLEAMKLVKEQRSINKKWLNLKHTKREVENIATLFKAKSLKNTVKLGIEATEDNFKILGVREESPTIIHLATHGFFYTNTTMTDTSIHGFNKSSNPLIRSGLVLAGANKVWTTGESYNNMEDGILTAYEISNMNLSHTKLAVLSACETGLGAIQGTEGVYGLQRAFKIAGVDYILMSLWQVSDAETADLMQTFYKNYLQGMSIRQAFNLAQELMKKDYNYTPAYWAGFVLMR